MKIDIQKRYSFKYYDDLIEYMITNHYELNGSDLRHIFNKMKATESKSYNNLGCAIIYLLDELKEEKYDRLIDLLNKCFEYKIVDGNYIYICNNQLIAKYLINLEDQLRNVSTIDEDESQKAFEDFKSLF